MAGTVLWLSVACALISVASAVTAIAVLGTDPVREHRFARIWLFMHGITAGLAATYYSKVVRWQLVARLRQYHDNFLWLTRALGVPVMAAHLSEAAMGLQDAGQVLAGVGIAVFAIGCWARRHRQLVTSVANALVMAVMAVLCCLHRSFWGLCWVVLLSLTLVTGTHGSPLQAGPSWIKVARIDASHLLLAACNGALVLASQ